MRGRGAAGNLRTFGNVRLQSIVFHPRVMRLIAATVLLAVAMLPASAADKYTGPRPPKPDVPYLLHADNLVETEAGVARMENRKDLTVAVIDGATSPVKTPLSEPIFVVRTDRLQPDKFELYKLESKGGRREVVIGGTGKKNGKVGTRPVYLSIRRLDDRLYQIEVDEPLENGEYSLTPQGADNTFSFSIY